MVVVVVMLLWVGGGGGGGVCGRMVGLAAAVVAGVDDGAIMVGLVVGILFVVGGLRWVLRWFCGWWWQWWWWCVCGGGGRE